MAGNKKQIKFNQKNVVVENHSTIKSYSFEKEGVSLAFNLNYKQMPIFIELMEAAKKKLNEDILSASK